MAQRNTGLPNSNHGYSLGAEYDDDDEEEEEAEPQIVIQAQDDEAGPLGVPAAAAPAAAAASAADDEKDVSEEIKKTWWACSVCTYMNKPNELGPEVPKHICTVCGQGVRPGFGANGAASGGLGGNSAAATALSALLSSPNGSAALSALMSSGNGNVMMGNDETGRPILYVTQDQMRAMMDAGPKKLTVANDVWNCSVCTFENDAYNYICVTCNMPTAPRALALGNLAKLCYDIITHPDEEAPRTIEKALALQHLQAGGSVIPLMQNLGFEEKDAAFVFPNNGSVELLKEAFMHIRSSILEGPKVARTLVLEEMMASGRPAQESDLTQITFDCFMNMSPEEKTAMKLVHPEQWAQYHIMGARLAMQAKDWERAIPLLEASAEAASHHTVLSYQLLKSLGECYQHRTEGDSAENNLKALEYTQQAQAIRLLISQSGGARGGCGDPNCTNCGGASIARSAADAD